MIFHRIQVLNDFETKQEFFVWVSVRLQFYHTFFCLNKPWNIFQNSTLLVEYGEIVLRLTE